MVISLIGYNYFQRSRLRLSPADSEMLGVSLAYLLGNFENEAKEAAQKVVQNKDRYKSDLTTHVNPTFYDIKVPPLYFSSLDLSKLTSHVWQGRDGLQ